MVSVVGETLGVWGLWFNSSVLPVVGYEFRVISFNF